MTNWGEKHGQILIELVKTLDSKNIRYFILRNYEGLPNINTSKDVDILVDPLKAKRANELISTIYKSNGLTHSYCVRYGNVYCWHGMDIENHLSIHIDLIAGYNVKGYEIFSFDELCTHTSNYGQFKVLDKLYEGLMVFIYKQFGYKKAKLKDEYKVIIKNTYEKYPRFSEILCDLLGSTLSNNILNEIQNNNFSKLLEYSSELSSALRKYAFRKNPIKVLRQECCFYWHKFNRLVLSRCKYIKSFSVMAPDGAGKTTFLDSLIDELCFYFTKEQNYISVYHFRPQLLPNLGEVGEKTGVMKQDKNFTVPHRAKPAGFFSSLVRITYYWLDYVLGWFKVTTKDIQFDKFTVFDRYGYDFLVDPHRTRLKLPYWIRKLYVRLMPHPKFTFYLDVEPNEIFRRKQELTIEEINRQVGGYKKLVNKSNRFVTLNGNRSVEQIKDDALKIVLDTFCTKLR